MKKKVKVAIIGTGSSPVKKCEKKRRVLGGVVANTLAPRALAREDTLILDGLVNAANQRAIELTVSPLADASEAYLSMPRSSTRTTESMRDISPSESAYMDESSSNTASFAEAQSYFTSSQSSQATSSSQTKLSPILQLCSLEDQSVSVCEVHDSAQMIEDICLQIPLPPSP